MSLAVPAEGRFGPAPLERRALPVTGRRTVGPYVILTVEDREGPQPAPGQFYMLAIEERWGGGSDERPFLPRALSVMDAADGRLEFMLEDVGPGTRELCEAEPGDLLLALGPLGRGFRAPVGGRAVICAGGIGVAPMALLARSLDGQPAILLGFRDAAHGEAADLFADARLATDDGSAGVEGNAVDLLRAELAEGGPATVYACGPPGMLEATREACIELGAAGQLALESGMACGYGACFGCVVPVAEGGYRRLCVDGPVLDANELAEDWLAAYG